MTGTRVDDPLDGRESGLALAHLHLRTGALSLARTELETMAGRDLLDAQGILDLAEVRWRTGDVAGAGEAVAALLDATSEGKDPPRLAYVLAAEAAAAHGRPTEAGRHADRARAIAGTSIDGLFAGLPRSSVWPADPLVPAPTAATFFPTGPAAPRTTAPRQPSPNDPLSEAREASALAEPGTQAGSPGLWDPGSFEADPDDPAEVDPELAAVAEAMAATDPRVPTRRAPARAPRAAAGTAAGPMPGPEAAAASGSAARAVDDGEPDLDPGAEFEAGRAALAAGRIDAAVVHLGLTLRLAPALAPAVLQAIEAETSPGLAFVRGDAYRLVGREREARRAYAAARPPDPRASPEPPMDAAAASAPPDPAQGDPS